MAVFHWLRSLFDPIVILLKAIPILPQHHFPRVIPGWICKGVLILLIVTSQANAAGIVSYQFELDQGNSALDSSGENNHGVILGTPQFQSESGDGSGRSLLLDGTANYVELGNLNVQGPGITLAVWFKAEQFPGRNQDTRLISKANGSSNSAHWFELSTIGVGDEVRLRGRLKINGGTVVLRAPSGYSLSAGQWHHAAITYDGDLAVLYLDGIAIAERSVSGQLSDGSGVPVSVGGRFDGNYLFKGLIDNIQILNVGISQAEVASLAFAPDVEPPTPDLQFDLTDLDLSDGNSGQIVVVGSDDSQTPVLLEPSENWISVSASSVETGQQVSVVAVTDGLPSGAYSGVIVASAEGFNSASLSVVLYVGPAADSSTVQINEILASNVTGLVDEEGDAEDWIELWNYGTSAVDIAGWCLTDDLQVPQMWCFPDVLGETIIEPGGYLVVFASKKDDIEELTEYHTNFKLGKGGEPLALYPRGATNPVSVFDPFPAQEDDQSYGYDLQGQERYFANPTPAALNDESTPIPDLEFNLSDLDLSDGYSGQIVVVGSDDSQTPVSLESSENWISLSASSVETGQQVSVVAVSDGLPPGTYSGVIVASAEGYSSASLSVNLRIGSSSNSSTVQINEILASNDTGLLDEEGDAEDWIELWNYGTSAVDIAGWCLTDDLQMPQMWCFPDVLGATIIESDGYLIVFASNKDDREYLTDYHTNFKLSKGGEPLALYPKGAVNPVTFFNPLPALESDQSYGFDTQGFESFFSTPTPGAANLIEEYAKLLFSSQVVVIAKNEASIDISAENNDQVAYELTLEGEIAEHVTLASGVGSNGYTSDQIKIIVDTEDLFRGVYSVTLSASSEGYESASATLEILVPVNPQDVTRWEVADIRLADTALAHDSRYDRLIYSVGSGYGSPTTFAAEIRYNDLNGYEVGIDGNDPVPSGTLLEFENLTYGSVHTIQLYINSSLKESSNIIFSNLPIVKIYAKRIVDEPDSPAVFQLSSYEFAEPGNHLNLGLEIRGATSQGLPKKSYGLDFTDLPELMNVSPWEASKQNHQFLDLRSDDDWILDASYRDTTFVRNLTIHSIWNDLMGHAYIDASGDEQGQPSLRGYLTEVILNDEYAGIYVLHEEVDRKLLGLKSVDVAVNDLGEEEWNLVDFADPRNGSVLYKADLNKATLYRPQLDQVSGDFDQKYPSEDDVQRYEPLQELIEFVDSSTDAEFVAEFRNWVDIDNLVDFWLLAMVSSSKDTLKKNYFIYRNEGGKFYFSPWDWDATFAMYWDGDYRSSLINMWLPERNQLFYRLISIPSTGFNLRMAQRWEELRNGLLSVDSITGRFEQHIRSVIPDPENEAVGAFARNKRRWTRSGHVGSNHPELRDIGFLKNWLTQRHQILSQQIDELEK